MIGQIRIGRAHQLLVVLDEIDIRVHQLTHHRGGLLRAKAERGLDDRTDDRPLLHACQRAASRNAELGTGMRRREFRRQLHIDDANAAKTLDRKTPPIAIVVSAARSVPIASSGNSMSASPRA